MASPEVIEMTRQELYDHVWSTPMRTLAGQWGISDVGLAKICTRHEIPRPPQGHWAKKRQGKTVRKTPLPAVEDKRLEKVTIHAVEPVEKSPDVDPEIAQLILQEADPDWAIIVSDGLNIRHHFLQATKEALKGMKPDKYGRVRPVYNYSETHFEVLVSAKNTSRAMRIRQTFIPAMEARGYDAKQKSDKSHHPYFDVLGGRFEVSIQERSKRSERKRDESKRDRWFYERYVYTPTGVLEFCLNHGTYSNEATFRDTATKPMENRLNDVIVSMLRIVDRNRKKAELARIEAAAKAERKKILIAQEIERRSDSVRIERLHNLTQAWQTHQRLSSFVNAVRAEAELRAPENDPDTIDWLCWADAYLREIDPLCGGASLPGYSLTDAEREQLRRECESDWNNYSETFSRRNYGSNGTSAFYPPTKPR
jgi:hypothetical protein